MIRQTNHSGGIFNDDTSHSLPMHEAVVQKNSLCNRFVHYIGRDMPLHPPTSWPPPPPTGY
eukprot:3055462-Amphidinium_carterae.1